MFDSLRRRAAGALLLLCLSPAAVEAQGKLPPGFVSAAPDAAQVYPSTAYPLAAYPSTAASGVGYPSTATPQAAEFASSSGFDAGPSLFSPPPRVGHTDESSAFAPAAPSSSVYPGVATTYTQPSQIYRQADPSQVAPQQGYFQQAPACPPQAPIGSACWDVQVLPDGLIYPSYMAGAKEPRLATIWNSENNEGFIWDIVLGGRVGLLRYGTQTGHPRPDGFQLDVEGAAFPRLDPETESDLVSADFRAGVPLTFGYGQWQTKAAYYHLSSHLGDEYLLKNPGVTRYNYSRDVLVLGQSYYATEDVRLYGEIGWAFLCDVGEPLEFQFGVDYSPAAPTGLSGSPFAAANVHLREEVDFGGNFVLQGGWQWRRLAAGPTFRAGLQYYNGKSEQFEFWNLSEQKTGFGLWYDF